MSKVVKIKWRDSAFHDPTVRMNVEEAANLTLIEIETVGFLVHEDDERVVVAIDRNQNGDNFRGLVSIPQATIVEYKVGAFSALAAGRKK